MTGSSHAEREDSVRIEYRERTVCVPDTVFVEIPAQTAERTSADSTSRLENDYARSEARINPDGTLFHRLATKAQMKPVLTEKQIEYRDFIVYRDRTKTATVTETKHVVRSLSWWQKAQIYGFWLVLAVVAVSCRKPFFSLVKRFIQIMAS